MATEQRLFNDLDAVSYGSWTNESNAFVIDDNCAVADFTLNGSRTAGGDFDNISYTPDSLDSFTVRFYDSAAGHANDTVLAQIYDLDSETWITCETFNSGNLLPTSLTTYDYTTEADTYFSAAASKTGWLNGVQFRLYCSVQSGPPDGMVIAYAWGQFTYEYTPAAGNVFIENKYGIEQGMKPETAAGMGGVLIE